MNKTSQNTFLDVLREFCRETTIHGLRYISRDGASISDRLCWVAAVVTCVVLAGVCVGEAWRQFAHSPIVVNVETTNFPLYKLPFPAITICPATNVKRRLGEQLLARYFNRSLEDAEFRNNLRNILSVLSEMLYPLYYRSLLTRSNITDQSLIPGLDKIKLSEFMLKVLPNCTEMFKSCNWIGTDMDCCESLNIQRSEAGFCYSFNSLSSEKTKKCTKGLPDEYLYEVAPLKKNNNCNVHRNMAAGISTGLEVFMAKIPEADSLGRGQLDPHGFRIMINHPLVPPESAKSIYVPEMPSTFFAVKISYTITMASQELRGLSISTRNCLFPDERKSKYFGFYTYETCLMECRIRYIIDTCKCYPHFFDIHEDGVPECNFSDLACISIENPTMRAFNPPGQHDWQETHEAKFLNCTCLPTCHEASFQIYYDRLPDSNPYTEGATGHLDVFYKDPGAVKYKRQLAFTFLNLIVSFGGFMGLFLGMSLLSGVELVYYFFKILLNIFFKKHRRDTLEKEPNENLMHFNKVSRLIYPIPQPSGKSSIQTNLGNLQMFKT